jgi:hypothetical protein
MSTEQHKYNKLKKLILNKSISISWQNVAVNFDLKSEQAAAWRAILLEFKRLEDKDLL